ncbi:MAG: tetratricopeptide repeat protein, partial [Spirochaetota bacterium]
MKRWTLLIVFLCTFCTQNESSAPSDNETRLSDAVYFDLLQQATNHLQSGKLKEAEQTLIKAETIAPRLPMAYYMRGILYYNQKDPESAGSYFMKALFRCTQDELPGLITDLDSLTSLPLSEEENRLIRKAENSSPESAIEHLTGALSLNGMNVLSHYLIGRAYRSLDKTKKAAYHFERAVLIHPAHRKSLTALTNIYENNGRMDKYTATLEKRMRFYGTSS